MLCCPCIACSGPLHCACHCVGLHVLHVVRVHLFKAVPLLHCHTDVWPHALLCLYDKALPLPLTGLCSLAVLQCGHSLACVQVLASPGCPLLLCVCSPPIHVPLCVDSSRLYLEGATPCVAVSLQCH